MPSFSVRVPHALPAEQAVARLQQFLEQVRAEHGDRVQNLRGAWSGPQLDFAFSALGLEIEGRMLVLAEVVHVEGALPLAGMFFRGTIEQTIRGELVRLLQPGDA